MTEAIPRITKVENLGLEALGVATKGGIITIDSFSMINLPGIYAIGDVSDAPMASHKAEYEGVCAKASNREISVGRFPFAGNGKAIAMGEDQGPVQVIFESKTGQLPRPHMIGARVTELIEGYVAAMNLDTKETHLVRGFFPHLARSEMMKEAVPDAYGRALNI